ncbi:peptidase, partial [Candidatus Saccharibacteria bacterium]
MVNYKSRAVVGRVEKIKLAGLFDKALHARIDTGATISSVWASNIHADDDGLHFTLLGEGHPLYTGEVIDFEEYSKRAVRSSNGQAELRYQIKTPVRIKGKRVNARITLADRSTQVYPVLIGR